MRIRYAPSVEELAEILWDEQGAIKYGILEVLAESVEPRFRDQFVSDLYYLIQDLESQEWSKQRIAERIVFELQPDDAVDASSRPEPHGYCHLTMTHPWEDRFTGVNHVFIAGHQQHSRDLLSDAREQMLSWDHLRSAAKGDAPVVVVSACGVGKTAAILALIEHLQGMKGVVLVGTDSFHSSNLSRVLTDSNAVYSWFNERNSRIDPMRILGEIFNEPESKEAMRSDVEEGLVQTSLGKLQDRLAELRDRSRAIDLADPVGPANVFRHFSDWRARAYERGESRDFLHKSLDQSTGSYRMVTPVFFPGGAGFDFDAVSSDGRFFQVQTKHGSVGERPSFPTSSLDDEERVGPFVSLHMAYANLMTSAAPDPIRILSATRLTEWRPLMAMKVDPVPLKDAPAPVDSTASLKTLSEELFQHQDPKVRLLAAASWLACDTLEVEKAVLPVAGPEVDALYDHERTMMHVKIVETIKTLANQR